MQKEGIFRIGGFRVEVGDVDKGKRGENIVFSQILVSEFV